MLERRRPIAEAAVLALASLVLPLTTSVHGLVFEVTSTTDLPDLTFGDGVCRVNPIGDPICTLRAAVQEANAIPGQDTILLPPGSFPLLRGGSDEDEADTGDLDIHDDLILRGAGAGTTIIAGMAADPDPDRVFDLAPLSGAPTVEIRDLTIRDGYAPTGHGIRNAGATLLLEGVVLLENGGELTGEGGALANLAGSVTLQQVRIQGNQNLCPVMTLCFGPGAGGIYNESLLTIRESLFVGNSGHYAGGLTNESSGVVAIENSTFSGNTGTGGPGGIYNAFGLSLVHVTLAENDGSSAHDLVNASGAVVSVRGSIFTSGTFGLKCGGPGSLLSGGFNLENGNTCGFSQPTDLPSTSPQLLPLAQNGGPTATYRLHPDSPAIDAAGACTGISGSSLDRDQRGSRRPADGDGDGGADCDIGAYEWLPPDIFGDGFESGDLFAWSQISP